MRTRRSENMKHTAFRRWVVHFVYEDLEYKFLHTERMSKDLLSAATRAWLNEGCSEVISVLKGEMRLYDYIVDKELKSNRSAISPIFSG